MRKACHPCAHWSLLLSVLIDPGVAHAETAAPPSTEEQATSSVAPAAARPDWDFDASSFMYVTPDNSFVVPSLAADHRWLHLEARYNYEHLRTASTWVGYNLEVGTVVTLKITPMLGAVFGATNGFAPGGRGSVNWRWLELYTEAECVFPFDDLSSPFVYFWSTLTASPTDWLRLGLVAQRTHTYQTELDIQRGFLLGLTSEHMGVTAYLLNPDLAKPTYVFALDVYW